MKRLYLLLILLGLSFSSLARVDIVLVCNKVGETKGTGVVKPTLYNTDINYFIISKNKISLLNGRYGGVLMELPFFLYHDKGKIEGSGTAGYDKIDLGFTNGDLVINLTRFTKFIATPDNKENKVDKTIEFSECYILDRIITPDVEEAVPFSESDNSDVKGRRGPGPGPGPANPGGHPNGPPGPPR